MPKSKFAERGKVKRKSKKSTAKLSSKRKLSRFGKVQKAGHAGNATTYVTRTKALKKLQLSIKDFRRLCILKGIYPREPRKATKGKHNTYYHYKDIHYLSHEPLLAKFRETKALMKKVKKAIGRKETNDAKRLYAQRPEYTLDHLVKERYPRFSDALADLDDALCMVHMYASLPAEKHIDPKHTALAQRLCKEWQAFVSKTRALTKVFLSIKGVYFQGEVCGQAVTWMQPWPFAHAIPRSVDFKVMGTFLHFHEVLLKFVMFKLYSQIGLAYPPPVVATASDAGVGLAALQLQKKTSTGSGAASAASTTLGPGAEVKALQAVVASVVKRRPDALAADEEDSEGSSPSDSDDDEALAGENEAVIAAAKQRRQQKKLFKGLTFFLSREVPRDLFEFIGTSCGARVGWDGEGSKIKADDTSITHVIVDRPTVTNPVAGREYVQPQWVVDSINTVFLLPIARYAPGAELPPHLSPFVDDSAKGYIPQYREQLNKLRAAAAVTGQLAGVANGGAGAEALEEEDSDEEEDSEEEDSDEEDDSEEDEDEDEDEEEEEAVPAKKQQQGKHALNAVPASSTPQAASAAVIKKRKATDMQIADERRKLQESMLSNKKAKQYRVVMHAKSKAAEEVNKLAQRRAAIESPKNPKDKAPMKKRRGGQ